MLQVLRHQLLRAQHRMKQLADKHRSERSFAIDDMVFLKLQPYRQTLMAHHGIHKFFAKYYGPFKIKDKVGKVAYQLDLPSSAAIHDIFHVSLLKKARGSNWMFTPLPVPQKVLVEPLAILKRRMVKRGNQAAAQLLIHWSNSSPAKATWEFASEIKRRFLNFSLDDKGFGEGEKLL